MGSKAVTYVLVLPVECWRWDRAPYEMVNLEDLYTRGRFVNAITPDQPVSSGISKIASTITDIDINKRTQQ